MFHRSPVWDKRLGVRAQPVAGTRHSDGSITIRRSCSRNERTKRQIKGRCNRSPLTQDRSAWMKLTQPPHPSFVGAMLSVGHIAAIPTHTGLTRLRRWSWRVEHPGSCDVAKPLAAGAVHNRVHAVPISIAATVLTACCRVRISDRR